VIAQFPHCYVIKDKHPVTQGHLLIIPNEHFKHWFEAPEKVHIDMMSALNQMQAWLKSEYNPDGFNIGMNCDIAAGQSIMHLHVHLIPRYKGDSEDPPGGVRGVIPSKQKYS